MPIADKKKCQTLINIACQAVRQIQGAADRLEVCRTAYQTQNVDPTGTPLEGNVAPISAWIDSVRSVANAVVPNAMLAHEVPTHRNKALGEL